MKDLKDVDKQTDLLGIEFRTLYLIRLGLEKEEAFAEALRWARVRS